MKSLKEIQEIISAFCLRDPENRLPDGRIIFDNPLVGIADANDPLLEDFKKDEIIGPHFRHPTDWLPGAVSIISYFLPFREEIRLSNYGDPPPSLEWLHSRFLGESFNEKLRRYLASVILKNGERAVAPLVAEEYFADYDIFSSNWSERHIAYLAGLGSFGLHRGLITDKGVAGRFGSVITNLNLPVSRRPAGSYYQNCPFLVEGSCGMCIERCPAGAITEEGKDKGKCHQYMFIEDHLKELRLSFGYKHSVCGKCQVDVPCEDCIPFE